MNYDRYYTCDVVNGEGLRVTLFVTGCEHACPGCYNTSCWNRLAGKPFTPEVRDGVLDLCRDHDGLSLSGGDPLLPANREAIADPMPLVAALDKCQFFHLGVSVESMDTV